LFFVEPDEAGVRTTLGYKVKAISPGPWLFWPCIQEITTVTVTPQPIDLRGQSVISNGKDYAISGAVLYRITDAEKAILRVQDFDHALCVRSLGVIAVHAKSHDLSQPNAIDQLREDVLKGIREAASGWGLKIMEVSITDIGHVTNIRVIGDTTIIPIVGDEE